MGYLPKTQLILRPSILNIKICQRLKYRRLYSRNSIVVQINGSILETYSSHWFTIMSRYAKKMYYLKGPTTQIINKLEQLNVEGYDSRRRIDNYMKELFKTKSLVKPVAKDLDAIINTFNILKYLCDKIESEVLCDYVFMYALIRKLDKETLKGWNK